MLIGKRMCVQVLRRRGKERKRFVGFEANPLLFCQRILLQGLVCKPQDWNTTHTLTHTQVYFALCHMASPSHAYEYSPFSFLTLSCS